jgi:hypothetical protein
MKNMLKFEGFYHDLLGLEIILLHPLSEGTKAGNGSPSSRVKVGENCEKGMSFVGSGKNNLPNQQEDKQCQASIA